MIERFSASQVARHMQCHASADLGSAIPNWQPPVEDPTKVNAANRGTNMHEIAERIGEELTPKEMAGFGRAIEYVGELRQRRRFTFLREASIKATWLESEPDTTADVVLYTKDELHIVDYKFGKIPVEAVGNPQLLYYAACFAGLAPNAKGAELHIVQPFADNITSWYVTAAEIQRFMDEAIVHERAIQAGDRSFGPSDECKFCPANPHTRGDKGRPLCPAMMNLLYPSAGVDEEEMLNG